MKFRLCLLLGLHVIPAFSGCGSDSGDVPTDPGKLAPLTEAQKAEIQKQDADVAAEEGRVISSGKKAN